MNPSLHPGNESAPGSLRFRPMAAVDLPQVMCVERAAYSHPWTEGIMGDCLGVGYSCWVGLVDRRIVSHGILALAGDECHLLNLCVHPRWQGRGIGRALLRKLLAIVRQHRIDTLFLEVRRSNRSARQLYRSEGFCEIGIRRGYYPTSAAGREDAILMGRFLAPDQRARESRN